MKKSANQQTRRAIITLLKQFGAMDSQTLATRLGVSAMAVRQHLSLLQAEQLVTYQEEIRAMGRPVKQWQLTAAADRFFPSGYAELTLSLIDSIVATFGEAGLDRLLDVRTSQQLATYQTQIPAQDPLQQKLETLVAIRTQEGYMAEVQYLEDGSTLLIENHCPICAAAQACMGFCGRELEVFQQILGAESTVTRTEHIVAGARRCVYHIQSISG